MPRDDATETDVNPSSEQELKDRIVRLTEQLTDAEGRKKSAMESFNSEIKDLKAEIRMTMELLKRGGEDDA